MSRVRRPNGPGFIRALKSRIGNINKAQLK